MWSGNIATHQDGRLAGGPDVPHVLDAQTASGARPTRPRPNTVVAVLAFAGIVVALMQTLVIPLDPGAAPAAGRHRRPTPPGRSPPPCWRPPSPPRSWAGSATCTASAGCCWSASACWSPARSSCALSDSLVTDDRRPGPAGPGRRGRSRSASASCATSCRAERLGSATALMSASLGVGGALGLPAAALLAEHADWHVLFWAAAGLGVVVTVLVLTLLVPESPVAHRRTLRPARRGRAVVPAWSACCWRSPRAPTGAGPAASTLGLFVAAVGRPARLGLVRAAHRRSRWWTCGPPPAARCCSPTSPRSCSASRCSRCRWSCRSCCSCPKATGYGLGQSMLAAGLVMAPVRPGDDGDGAGLGDDLQGPRPEGHPDARRRRGRRRLRPGQSC